MAAPNDHLLEIASRQHGLVTRAQVIDATGSKSAADSIWRSNNWEAITSSVSRRAGAPRTTQSIVLAAVLDAGGDAALADLPAANRWGLTGCDLRPLSVITTRSSRRRTSLATTLQVRRLPTTWSTVLDGIPIIRPEFLALRLFATCREERAERLVERLWSLRLLCGATVARFLSDMGTRGRNGTAGLRRFLDARGPDYLPPASGLESRVGQILRQEGIAVRRQVDSGGTDWVGRVDFRHATLPLLIEVQSEAYHSALVDRATDRARLERLRNAGFVVVELWDTDVWARPWKVAADVRTAICRARGIQTEPPRTTERGFRGE